MKLGKLGEQFVLKSKKAFNKITYTGYEIAEGNIIGSCIINSCLILGAGAFIADIPLTANHIKDMALLLVCIVLIWLFAISNKENILKRSHGIILLIIYLIYSIKLFI